MSRRIGVMGGTFDPIHHGHLVAAEEARWQFDLDRVVFVPAGRPWQKPVGVSPAEDRYQMTVIATATNPAFTVSRLEIDHEGPTYTVDTLRRLMSAECSAHPLPPGRLPAGIRHRGRLRYCQGRQGRPRTAFLLGFVG